MRGDADAALGRRHAEILAHRPRQPRVAGALGRPHALVEPAQHEPVGMLQPRLEQAPDEKPRMAPEGRPHHRPGDERLEQRRIIAARERRAVARRVEQIGRDLRRRLARRLAPQPRGAGLGIAARQCLGGGDVRGDELREIGRARRDGCGQRRQRATDRGDEGQPASRRCDRPRAAPPRDRRGPAPDAARAAAFHRGGASKRGTPRARGRTPPADA